MIFVAGPVLCKHLLEERNAVRIAAFDMYGFSARSKGPKTTRRLVVTKSGKAAVSTVDTKSTDAGSANADTDPTETAKPSMVGSGADSGGADKSQLTVDAANSESCDGMPPPELPLSGVHSSRVRRKPKARRDRKAID